MNKIASFLAKLSLSLTAAVVLTAAIPVQAATAALTSGPLLLAQSAEPKPEKAPCQTPAKKESGASKSMAPPAPSPRMEEGGMKKRGMAAPRPMPEASGTKKMGGQTIRNREAPEGE